MSRRVAWPPRPGGVVAALVTEAVREDRRYRGSEQFSHQDTWLEWTSHVEDVELIRARAARVST